MSRAWVLDIETVPEGLEPGERIKVPDVYRLPYTPPEPRSAPRNYKRGGEAWVRWHQEEQIRYARLIEAEEAAHAEKCREAYLRTALHPRRCQVVAWAAVPLAGGEVVHHCGADEVSLLSKLQTLTEPERGRVPLLLAWNGPGFDFPVIRARALVCNLPRLADRFAPRAWNGRVFTSSNQLLDLMPFAPEAKRGSVSKKDAADAWGVTV